MIKSEPQPEANAGPQPEATAKTPSDLTPQVSKRAHELYEERGRQSDPAVRDWEQAAREVQESQPNDGPKPAAKDESKPETEAPPKPESKATPSSSMKKKTLVAGALVLAVLGALAIGFGVGRWWGSSKKATNQLVLFGNVDLRQVELAFNNSERIAEVLVQEGDKVTRGQILARLDTSRLKPQTAAAEAEAEAQQAVVQKLHHGSRPEEIAQAQANVASAKADQVNAEQQWKRLTALSGLTTGRAISQQDLDGAKAALDAAQARLDGGAKGPRSILDRPKDGGHRSRGGATARRCKPNLISSAGNWPTPNWFPRAMPWCGPGSWSLAKWCPRNGRFSIWPSRIQNGSGPTFPSPIWERSTWDESLDQNGQFSRPSLFRLGRLHFFRCRIHAQGGPDRGVCAPAWFMKFVFSCRTRRTRCVWGCRRP